MPRPPPAPLTPQPPCWAWRTGWTVAPGQTAAGGQRQRGGPINSVAGVGGEVGRAQLGHPPPLASRTRRWQRGGRPHVSRAAVRLATVSLGALVPVPEPRKQGAQGWRQHGKWPLCLLPWRRPGGLGEGSVEGEAAVGNTGSARAGRGACREASLSWSGKWGHCLPEGRGARRERMTMKRALGDRRPFWRPPPGHARALSFSRSSNMQPLSPTRRHRTSFHQ